MTFRAPLDDLLFVMTHGAGLGKGLAEGVYPDLDDGMAAALLAEAGKFAESVLAPLNRVGDKEGARLENGVVTTAPGWYAVRFGLFATEPPPTTAVVML